MQLPPVTPELVSRFERVIDALGVSGMARVRELPGNPFGVEIRQYGSATAALARHARGPGWWNRARGICEEEAHLLPAIAGLYREWGLRCHIDLGPGAMGERLGRQLTECGFYATTYSTILYGAAKAPDGDAGRDIDVREVGVGETELFAELWASGFEVPDDGNRRAITEIRKGWFLLPENRRYIAYVGGEPAAMAALYIRDGIGFLNVGATLPAFRRRGCHTALTHRRICDAAAAGCELVIGHTGFGGKSQNNEERLGLHVAFTPVNWTDGFVEGTQR